MTDIYVESKKFDGTNITFVILPDGTELVTVQALADYFGMPLKQANRIITRNRDLFEGKVFKIKTEDANISGAMMTPIRMKYLDCLSYAGGLQWINSLSYLKYEGERKDKIIDLKNWLVALGEAAMKGTALIRWQTERASSKTLANTVKRLLKEKIMIQYTEPHKHNHVYMNEFKMINTASVGEHKRGIKDTLNVAGLEINNMAHIIDIALLSANVTDYYHRKESIPL